MRRKSPIDYSIPETIHLIWFGATLSDAHQKNIKEWKRLNSEYSVLLWVEDKGSQSFYNNKFHNTGVEIKNIECHDSILLNYDLIRDFLSKKMYHAASDTLRIDLLAAQGGYYFDVDITPLRPLEDSIILSDIESLSCMVGREKYYAGELAQLEEIECQTTEYESRMSTAQIALVNLLKTNIQLRNADGSFRDTELRSFLCDRGRLSRESATCLLTFTLDSDPNGPLGEYSFMAAQSGHPYFTLAQHVLKFIVNKLAARKKHYTNQQ